MALPAASELGVIRARDGWSYRITPEDVLWLARAAKYEGGNKAATLWTYAQRLANFRGTNMTNLVRAHSQTINPDWASATAPGCVRRPDQCTPAALARRAQAANAPWESLSTAPITLQWAQAAVRNPAPRATDFAIDQAGNAVVTSFLTRHPDSRVVLVDGNTYIAAGPSAAPGGRPAPTAWPADFVSIEYDGRRALAAAAGVGIGGVAAAGVGLYLLWRWTR